MEVYKICGKIDLAIIWAFHYNINVMKCSDVSFVWPLQFTVSKLPYRKT